MASTKTKARAKGLDVGTSRMVLAQVQEGGYEFEAQLNAFVSFPHTKVTEAMLRREEILYTLEDSEILAFGNGVERFANLLGGDTRRPMKTGLLNSTEPKSLAVMRFALERLCGKAETGETLCFSIPSPPASRPGDAVYHERTVKMILEQLGYQVNSVNEALAVVYSELESTSFTGIGMSFGGGMCNIAVAYLGLPVLSFSTPLAGDHIDHSAASVTGRTPATVRLHKEHEFAVNGLARCDLDQALSVYYHEMIDAAVSGLTKELSQTNKLPTLLGGLNVVVSGGSAQPEGFLRELERSIRAAKFPVKIADVRMAENPLNTTAKGTLMAAMLEV